MLNESDKHGDSFLIYIQRYVSSRIDWSDENALIKANLPFENIIITMILSKMKFLKVNIQFSIGSHIPKRQQKQ